MSTSLLRDRRGEPVVRTQDVTQGGGHPSGAGEAQRCPVFYRPAQREPQDLPSADAGAVRSWDTRHRPRPGVGPVRGWAMGHLSLVPPRRKPSVSGTLVQVQTFRFHSCFHVSLLTRDHFSCSSINTASKQPFWQLLMEYFRAKCALQNPTHSFIVEQTVPVASELMCRV